ncbi:NACHT domain-containing protein [Streptomyces sp. A0592]|uniref:NACHT domain-containing protein n=1 Tax=Streptomyces sp. A0592 TaxID=2563099 RepID=UPI00109E728C|nr:NACHT domain-containing protein [Streptomyces sp. A0592]THA85253.1 NACHT domain-containing protein [Streptomyces sp. A0592]
MEPGTIGIRLASAAVGPLVKRLFVSEGGGAGLVDKPIRISGYVSFTGEKRTLTDAELHDLAAKLVKQALRTGERPVLRDEELAVIDALASTLYALGDLTMTDLDAVGLGSADFARELRRAAGRPEKHLSADATYFYERLVEAACVHVLQFFTGRSTFVAHALVQQTRRLAELTAKVDELIRRAPLPGAEDTAFEQQYLPYVENKHSKLTIYGVDLINSPARWPLDTAYLSLEATSLHGQRLRTERHAEPRGTSAAAAAAAGAATRTNAFLDGLDAPDPVLMRTVTRGLRAALEPRPADQALAGSPRVLLRGEAGSGKTTLVQWLAVTAARQDLTPQTEYLDDRIPFVLPLRTLTRHGERLPAPADFLAASGCPLGAEQPAGWAHRILATGRGLVLVDGIDEIPDAERERARGWLRDLMDTYGGDNRWLVTSRPSAVGADWLADEGFTELTLSAMGRAEVATFIRRWHTAAREGGDTDAKLRTYESQLLTAVRTKPDLGRLATNPLMCGLICALHRDRSGYLPHGRKDLYEAALSMLLSRRDRERDMAVPDLREEPQLDLLQRLAYWLIKNGRTEMDRSRAEEIIARALPAVREAAALGGAPVVFEYFLQRSGLLRAPASATVEFVHRTFQDFLGARAAVEESDFGLLTSHADDDQWEDVIRMAVALARPAERVAIIRDLLARGENSTDQRTRARIYLLAAACLEHATTLDPEVRAAVEARTATLIPPANAEEARALAKVGPLVLSLLPGPEKLDDMDAYHVVIAASRVGSDSAVSYLAQFVAHPWPPVRSELLLAWPRFDSAEYADEVVAHLDPAGLHYTVRSDDQLDQLERLAVRPEGLIVRSGVSSGALAAYLGRHGLQAITFASESTVSGLECLRGQSALHTLEIDGCPDLADLSAIGGLPIRRLNIATSRPDLDLRAVAQLGHLEALTVDGPAGLSWSPRELPTSAPLQGLLVRGETSPAHGLDGLGSLPGLVRLVLNAESSPASAADWQEIRALHHLAGLRVSAASVGAMPAGMTLPGVNSLTLDGTCGEKVLRMVIRRLPLAFPGLGECRFPGKFTAEGDTGIDIGPLGGLPGLKEIQIPASRDRVRGAELLPPSVRLYFT